jgi:hypothetical protein
MRLRASLCADSKLRDVPACCLCSCAGAALARKAQPTHQSAWLVTLGQSRLICEKRMPAGSESKTLNTSTESVGSSLAKPSLDRRRTPGVGGQNSVKNGQGSRRR